MDDGSRISILIVILMLFGAIYFAVCETAFASVSRTRLKVRIEHGDRRAERALWITEHMDRAITTILIGTNITHLATASLVTVMVTRLYGLSAVTVSTLITTLAVFFFGEMMPKSIARKYCESLSLLLASSLQLFMTLFAPLSAILTAIGQFVSGLTKGEPEASVTEDELYDIIEDMTESGAINEEQGDLISSALQFGDVTVESILTSRVDMAAINIDMNPEELLAFIKEQNHSRLPVYEGTIDHIVGILHVRSYIKRYVRNTRRGEAPPDIRPLLSKPYFVHQSTKIDDLLPEMSRQKLNVAIVTDNYGGTLGLVTVEDILEELVGEIWDEDDQAIENIIQLPDGSYSINPEEHVLDVLDELDLAISEEEEDDLQNKLMSELAYEAFALIPTEGQRFTAYGMQIVIARMAHNRIMRLKVKLADERENPAEAESADLRHARHQSEDKADRSDKSAAGKEAADRTPDADSRKGGAK